MSPEAGTNVVDVYVNYLRKKLGGARAVLASYELEQVIETVRGKGYVMSLGSKRKTVEHVESDAYKHPVAAAAAGMWQLATA